MRNVHCLCSIIDSVSGLSEAIRVLRASWHVPSSHSAQVLILPACRILPQFIPRITLPDGSYFLPFTNTEIRGKVKCPTPQHME